MNVLSITKDEGCPITVGELVHVDDGVLRGNFKVESIEVFPDGDAVEIKVEVAVGIGYQVVSSDYCEW